MTINKNTTQLATCRSLNIIYFLIAFMIFSSGCIDNGASGVDESSTGNMSIISTDPIENIHETLVGHNLTYYDIAGNKRNYSISKKDIGTIEISEFNDEDAWVVNVGHGMAWEIHLNETGEKIIGENQLFRT